MVRWLLFGGLLGQGVGSVVAHDIDMTEYPLGFFLTSSDAMRAIVSKQEFLMSEGSEMLSPDKE